jgi:hypothetical protein
MRISIDLFPAIAFLFARANGNKLGEYEQGELEKCGLSKADPDQLAEQLLQAIEDDDSCDATLRGASYSALGKRFDKSLLPFFRRSLRRELARDMHAIYQIMIALDNLNEPIFSEARDGGYSSSEIDLNRTDAEGYLAQFPG